MSTNLETLKNDYLAEFSRAVPKLKSLATAIRQHEQQLTTDDEIDKFWAISGDPRTDYELCQVAADLDGFDQFFEDNIAPKLTQQAKASDQPAIANEIEPRHKNKDLMGYVMELYSLAAVLNTAYEAFPQTGPGTIINSAECVRYAAEKLADVAGEIEKTTF